MKTYIVGLKIPETSPHYGFTGILVPVTAWNAWTACEKASKKWGLDGDAWPVWGDPHRLKEGWVGVDVYRLMTKTEEELCRCYVLYEHPKKMSQKRIVEKLMELQSWYT